MGFNLSSIGSGISNVANTVAKGVETAAKAAGNLLDGVGNKPAPEAPAKPVDTFEAAPKSPATCGGNSTEGAQCLPASWGRNSGGGGGKAGVGD
jgi:hypothetical protein